MVTTDHSVAADGLSLFVGTPSLHGDVAQYARRFDMLELSAEAGRHPKRTGLLAMRRAVPEAFVFSVALPSAVAALEHGDRDGELLREAESMADAVEAAWWVLRTPPSVTPSARSGRALDALVQRLKSGGRRVAWEPRGVWRDEESLHTAQSLGVYLVRDLLREDPPPDQTTLYTRIRALGEGAQIGAAAAERIAERLEGVTEAYVVIEGFGAARARKVLRAAWGLGAQEPSVGEDDSEEDEEAALEAEDDMEDVSE